MKSVCCTLEISFDLLHLCKNPLCAYIDQNTETYPLNILTHVRNERSSGNLRISVDNDASFCDKCRVPMTHCGPLAIVL